MLRLSVQYVFLFSYHVSLTSSSVCSLFSYYVSLTFSSVCFPFQLPCQLDSQFTMTFIFRPPCHSYLSYPRPYTIPVPCHPWQSIIRYLISMLLRTLSSPDHIWSTPYHDTPFTILYMITTLPLTPVHYAIYKYHIIHVTQFTISHMNPTYNAHPIIPV